MGLKCTCRDDTRQFDPAVIARPVSPPLKVEGQCKTYARIALHLDLAPHGQLVIRQRQQFIDRDESNKDFNDMGGYDLCHGKELTPPRSATHCSLGNRIKSDSPCLTRLEQLTYDEAKTSCKERGGRLAKIQSIDEAEALRKFGRKSLGIGLRDFGADDGWRFDDGTDATDAVNSFQEKLASKEASHRRRRRAGNEFRRHGCVMVSPNKRGPVLVPLDCEAKSDWVCEGTLANPPNG